MSTDSHYRQSYAKPKVLHILADVMPGGMETLLLNLVRQSKLSGSCDNAIAVVQMADDEGSLRPSLEKVAEFHDLNCDSFFSFDFIKKLRALLREVNPDVVHCWSHDSGVVAGAVARYLHNTKVTWAIHSLDLPSRGQYTPLRFNVLKILVGVSSRLVPHRIISCSDTATHAHVGFGYPLARCLTIDNGIDADRFQINPQTRLLVRNQLGIPANAPVVGYIGRSHPVKRIEDFFAAAAILMEKCPEMHFITLGFSLENLYPAAELAYALLPDPARMHILGRRPDPENYIPAFDVTALTSESEALPMVLMESLACGVPCVSTNVGSASRVVGPHGKCVPAMRPDLMADALLSQLKAASRNTVSAAMDIRRRCLDHFSIIMAEQHYGDCYKQLTNPDSVPVRTEAPNHKKTRVFHLVNDLGYGGAQVLLKRLSIGLKQKGFEQCVVSVLPLEKIGKLAPEFENAGIPVFSLGVSGPISGLRGVVRFAAMIREQQPNLIQTWLFHSALIGELAALLSMRDTKTLWSIHHTLLGKESSKFATRAVHRVLAWISPVMPQKIIYCSKAGLDLHHDCGFDRSKSELIFNGTDTNTYRPDPEAKAALRSELGIPANAPLIGMAGRYHPQKDFPNLLRAFAIVQQAVPDAHLLACGPEVSRDTVALRELADACPSPGQVHLIGPRRDMAAIYPAFTLGALSSCEGEAFPLVLGEAMACEVPCIATDVGDSALIIGDTGRVVPPRNPEALAAEMILLLKLSENELKELGKAARQRVRRNFALDTYINAHASLYNRLSVMQGICGSGRKLDPPPPVLIATSPAFIPKMKPKAPAA